MLTEKQVAQLKDELLYCSHPVFFFDDDPDGLCSFLLLYRFIKEGVGIVIKAKPMLEPLFAKKANDYGADKVFVLDMPDIEQDFIDQCKAPIVWVDHHPLKEHSSKVKYFNSLQNNGKMVPTSYTCYRATREDLWIAALGTFSDWVIVPELKSAFCEKYPDLLDPALEKPGDIIYNSRLGTLMRIFSFNLKGKTSDVKKAVKILTRIESPYELLEGTTDRAKLLLRRFEKINKEYEKLFGAIEKSVSDDPVLLYKYQSDVFSLTSDVSNELIYKHPDKIIIIAREKSGFMRCSLRSSEVNLAKILEKAIVGIEGYGGGHPNACGANIKKEDFDLFIDNLRRELDAVKNN